MKYQPTEIVALILFIILSIPLGFSEELQQDTIYTNKHRVKSIARANIYNFNARYVDPFAGRFVSPDPVVQPTAQFYSYTNNNPITYSDPTGRMTVAGVLGAIEYYKSSPTAFIAEGLEGSFNWVVEGPDLFLYMRTGKFTELSATSRGRGSPWVLTENDFARWLNGNLIDLSRESRLNCWEAQMAIAYFAGAITKEKLSERYTIAYKAVSALHVDGVGEFEVVDATPFGQSIAYDLGYPGITNTLGEGNGPKRGDMIFYGQDQHIALYLGKNADGVEEVMSLFNEHGPHLTRMPLNDLTSLIKDLGMSESIKYGTPRVWR